MEPDEFVQGYWVQASKGCVVAPAEERGTCRAGSLGSALDFFYVHPLVEARVKEVGVDESWPNRGNRVQV